MLFLVLSGTSLAHHSTLLAQSRSLRVYCYNFLAVILGSKCVLVYNTKRGIYKSDEIDSSTSPAILRPYQVILSLFKIVIH